MSGFVPHVPVLFAGAVWAGAEVPEMHVVKNKTVTPRHANSTHPNGVCCAAYCLFAGC